ncbi:Type II secretion system protein D precursor [Botrimarina colliarenosi]|uniref:Type II secretion system protein D n=1 Tax=Botrimarina colliarenosi TaxID=2528001 RepID=A0A5C6A9V1_9BACT|nr:type II and III secretion system protein family protein [Botrimarina colliarenosi]TWT95975.1 Type II secretion system protein D precursor [Botrimarina colliarenosi]
MYDLTAYRTLRSMRGVLVLTIVAAATATAPNIARAQGLENGSVVRRIDGANDKLEITTNTSRILTLDKKIPKVQVNNPELLAVTPLSATEIQVSAKKAGVTQVNLWDEDGDIHTVDVFIYGDVRELEHALATQFPNSSVRVYRYSQSLVLTGFIDRPDYVDPIRQLAEDYAPKVINNIAVGGVQQVLLKVKIYEVSRTKLRQLGVDMGYTSGHGYFGTSVSGLINNVGSGGNPLGLTQVASGVKGITDTAGQTVEFAVTNGNDAFFGFIDALQRKSIAKILAEPNIVAVSGRPAQFNEGGEIPIIVPQSLGNVAIEYKPFGTQVDFLPIVLGNGKIRLEVRPRISDLDFGNAVTINNTQVPALTVRQVDTAVEMNAGQTFAIAGLIQQRSIGSNAGVPFLADLPIIGAPFRRVSSETEEVELLILVTPELVDAMEPHQVPPCGPGMGTVSPCDCDLYVDGKLEVPNYCGPCKNGGCGSCPTCVAGGFPGPPRQLVNGHQGGQSMGGAPTPAMAPYPMEESLPTPMEGPSLYDSSDAAAEPVRNGPPAHYRAAAPPSLVRQASRPYQPAAGRATVSDSGLIGPVGYDED